MRTESEIQVLAVELYAEVHSRLDHGPPEGLREHFGDVEPRAATWREVARLFDERVGPDAPDGRASFVWLEDYARKIYCEVNRRRNRSYLAEPSVFDGRPWVERRVWCEVACVFAESFNMEDPRLVVLRAALEAARQRVANMKVKSASAHGPCCYGCRDTGSAVMVSFARFTPYGPDNQPVGPEEPVHVVDVFMDRDVALRLRDDLDCALRDAEG